MSSAQGVLRLKKHSETPLITFVAHVSLPSSALKKDSLSLVLQGFRELEGVQELGGSSQDKMNKGRPREGCDQPKGT